MILLPSSFYSTMMWSSSAGAHSWVTICKVFFAGNGLWSIVFSFVISRMVLCPAQNWLSWIRLVRFGWDIIASDSLLFKDSRFMLPTRWVAFLIESSPDYLSLWPDLLVELLLFAIGPLSWVSSRSEFILSLPLDPDFIDVWPCPVSYVWFEFL